MIKAYPENPNHRPKLSSLWLYEYPVYDVFFAAKFACHGT